jgi:hypothetical protein
MTQDARPAVSLVIIRTRRMKSIIEIAVMAFLACAVADHYGRAAEPAVISLSCDGKLTNTKVSDAKPQSISQLTLVVNFAERTVSFSGHLVGIDQADVAHISFSGENNAVHGEIDRVTGAMWATTESGVTTLAYNLLCKPMSGAK